MPTIKHWIDALPSVGNKYRRRAREIEDRKAAAETLLAEAYADEAALWTEIGQSGAWTRKEMAATLLHMEPKLVTHYLPSNFPRPRKRRSKIP